MMAELTPAELYARSAQLFRIRGTLDHSPEETEALQREHNDVLDKLRNPRTEIEAAT